MNSPIGLNPSSAVENLASQILGSIISDTFEPGTRLHNNMFQEGRGVFRSTMAYLSDRNILSVRVGSTPYVRAISPAQYLDGVVASSLMESLFAARIAQIEDVIVRTEQANRLRLSLAEASKHEQPYSPEGVVSWLKAQLTFRLRMIDPSDVTGAKHLIERFFWSRLVLQDQRSWLRSEHFPATCRSIQAAQKAIIESIEAGDLRNSMLAIRLRNAEELRLMGFKEADIQKFQSTLKDFFWNSRSVPGSNPESSL